MSDHDHSDARSKPQHPGDKPLKADDPMEMMAATTHGDPLLMLDGIVEEYARMGWGREQIAELFDTPFFQATYGLKKLLGKEEIERRIDTTLQRCGVFRIRTGNRDPSSAQ